MNLLEVLSSREDWEAESSRVYGVVIGIVTNNQDQDGLGKIKVKFPWLKEDDESYWARLASPMAGKNRGVVFIPEVDDEVLVAFDHGDIRQPYIIGALWNGEDKPPEEKGGDGENNLRIIKSRSGHQVILDDTPGSEKVQVIDKNGNGMEFSSSGVVIKSQAIKVGSEGASEGIVLGNAFMTLFNAHTHPTGVGPSGPPATPMVKGSHVSVKHTTE
ncbi:MAG: phage tail protein [Deltaproteobacteria bacterium]|nr:phage tail protein [Deltaproteobacteria bacterium]